MRAQGKFYHCQFPHASTSVYMSSSAYASGQAHSQRAQPAAANAVPVRNETDCRRAGGKWVNHRYNFDNLGQALLALFVMASKDGWVQIMYQGIDAVGEDREPIENYNEWRMIYFIGFLLFVACMSYFFTFNALPII